MKSKKLILTIVILTSFLVIFTVISSVVYAYSDAIPRIGVKPRADDIRAWDATGNSATDTVTFTVDPVRSITYTFSDSLSSGNDSPQHEFEVPSGATLIEVELEMPSGADYDLSMWDDQNRRTGGWTDADHSLKTDIPNSDYSGYSADPEWINVDPPSTSGTWKVGCYAYSGSGTYTITVTITPAEGPDETPPTVTITNPTDGATLTTSDVTVSWTGSDNIGIDYYEIRIDSGSWTDKGTSTSHTYTGLANSDHTVNVRAWDAAGNSATDTVTFTVDAAEGDMGTGGDAYDGYSASDSATLLSQYASGTGEITYSSDQYDQYKVPVVAGDEVTLEFTPPSGATSLDFPIYDTDKSQIQISNNVKETIIETVTASGDGYIYFTIDADGSADTGTYLLTVSVAEVEDTTPPSISIDSPTDGQTVTTSDVTVSWTGSDNVGIDYYEIRIDGGSWTDKDTSTSHTYSGLPDGDHTVDVRAWDAAGNSATDTVTFTVNTIGPITYTFSDSLSSGNDSPQHEFEVPSGATLIEVELEMPSGADYDLSMWDDQNRRTGGWTDADHSLKTDIPNSDYSGYSADPEWINVDPPSTSGTWKVGCYAYSGSGTYIITVTITPAEGPDVTPPTVTITNPTDGATVYSADVTVSWTGSDNIGIDYYEIRIDSGSWTDKGTSTSHTYTGLADGSHTADVKAWDAAGNSATDTVTFTVDTTSNPVEKYAVIVGISDYKAINDLSYCDEDATDWYNHLTGTEMSFDHLWVYGDGHNSNYPQYDGYATEYNVKQALINIVNSADSNDIIVFTTSGHGSGNGYGSSYLCMWDCNSGENGEDGDLYDTELSAILDDAVADKIFVFIDHCYSGGFGPDLLNMPNSGNVYCTTTCTEDGYGYDDSSHQNGAWTYYFLEYAWINHYSGSATVSMEDIFTYAHSIYPYGGGDEPQEYDGNTSTSFYLS